MAGKTVNFVIKHRRHALKRGGLKWSLGRYQDVPSTLALSEPGSCAYPHEIDDEGDKGDGDGDASACTMRAVRITRLCAVTHSKIPMAKLRLP